jgi:hypothetical protein
MSRLSTITTAGALCAGVAAGLVPPAAAGPAQTPPSVTADIVGATP